MVLPFKPKVYESYYQLAYPAEPPRTLVPNSERKTAEDAKKYLKYRQVRKLSHPGEMVIRVSPLYVERPIALRPKKNTNLLDIRDIIDTDQYFEGWLTAGQQDVLLEHMRSLWELDAPHIDGTMPHRYAPGQPPYCEYCGRPKNYVPKEKP